MVRLSLSPVGEYLPRAGTGTAVDQPGGGDGEQDWQLDYPWAWGTARQFSGLPGAHHPGSAPRRARRSPTWIASVGSR